MNNFLEGGSAKWLTVAQLRRAINDLPEDACLQPNAVGNLAVLSATGEFLGFVDFLHDGEYVSSSA